jgi:hypothetical protein
VTADFLAILSWLAQAIVASGLTILGFVGLKSTAIGERWLDHYFQRKIAAFKHEQDKGTLTVPPDGLHAVRDDRRRCAPRLEPARQQAARLNMAARTVEGAW